MVVAGFRERVDGDSTGDEEDEEMMVALCRLPLSV